jgi:hypothetical protein
MEALIAFAVVAVVLVRWAWNTRPPPPDTTPTLTIEDLRHKSEYV